MSKLISATDVVCRLRRLLGEVDGSALVEFGLILPVLRLGSFVAIEFTITMFDYHQLGEAARRGARAAIINPPVAKLETLQTAGTIVCTDNGSVSCGSPPVLSSTNFTAVLSSGVGSGRPLQS